MKAFEIFFFVHFRIFMPLILLAAVLARNSATSFVYLVCLLMCPLLPNPSKRSMNGVTGIFLKWFILVSLLPVLGHIIYHIIFLSMSESDGVLAQRFSNCSYFEKVLRQIGYQSLKEVNVWNILRMSVPDIAVFSLAVASTGLSMRMKNLSANISAMTSDAPLLGGERKKLKQHSVKVLFEYLQNMALLVAAYVSPSLLGGVYFLTLLGCLTTWGCFQHVGSSLKFLQMMLLLFTGLHIMLLYLYQFQFFQDILTHTSPTARLLGLSGIIKTNCDNPSKFELYSGIKWSVFVNALALLVLYWIIAINIRLWFKIGEDGATRKKPMKKQVTENDGFLSHESDRDRKSDTVIVEVDSTEISGSSLTDANWAMKRKPWMSVTFMIMKHSHVLTLMSLMAWSITYHSMLTFVFLLTACILWLMPNTRQVCLCLSPLLVLYAESLLVGQYIICMNFSNVTLSQEDTMMFYEIGFKRFPNPFLDLSLQTVYTCFILLTLRQYCYERHIVIPKRILMKSRKSLINRLLPLGMEYTTYDSMFMIHLGNFLWLFLCKYWIFFCTIMMAVVSLQEIVIYRIIYMVLFLVFILTFNLNFSVWRSINHTFWWVVAIYSIMVLTLMYTYQFENAHIYWTNVTGFDDDLLSDIGLQKYNTAGLFKVLLTPTCFLVIVILQLRYFHATFLELSSLDRFVDYDKDSNVNKNRSRTSSLGNKSEKRKIRSERYQHRGSMVVWLRIKSVDMTTTWSKFNIYIWRLGQIHIFKLVIFTTVMVAVNEVSAMTAGYMFLVAILLPIPHTSKLLSSLLLLWTSCIILAKMVFELHITDDDFWTATCYIGNASVELNLLDNAAWFGFKKYNPEKMSFARYLWLYMLVLAIIVFESIIRYHQQQFYANPMVRKPRKGILFHKITRLDADKGVISCMKYFANYFFYKFGLECCYIMTAIVVCVRLDAISLLYLLITACLVFMPRRLVAPLWFFYKLILALFLAVEFLVVLGFPYSSCISYPWSNDDISVSKNLRQWLYLPEYYDPPKAWKLIGSLAVGFLVFIHHLDFFQLLFVSLQAYVFSIESSYESIEEYGGGDNADILPDVEENLPIPCMDFTLEQKSAIETIKFLVFENMYWVTMAIIFITGTTRVNIFSFFYMMAVFIFMWFGKEFCIKPLRELLTMWNYLIGYCILVLFLKTALQLLGCVYVDSLINNHQCWIVQLFGIQCLLSDNVVVENSNCVVEPDNAGLAWDVVCLIFLLLQRRIYSSHYFRHTADTILAQSNLVAKGAEIINRILIRDVQRRNEDERQLLLKIKKQMRDLKTRQARLKKDYQEPEEHFQAIRSGDYYLLDYEQNEYRKSTVQVHPEHNADNIQTEKDILRTTSSPVDFSESTDYYANMVALPPPQTSVCLQEEEQASWFAPGFGVLNAMYGQFLTLKRDSVTQLKVEPSLEPATVNKIRMAFSLLSTLWFRFIDWLIYWCNKLSYNYRLVAKKLSKELIVEKEKILTFKQTRRTGAAYILHDIMKTSDHQMGCHPQYYSAFSLDELEKQDTEEIKQQFVENTQRFNRLIVSGGLVLVSHSELLCYFLMILNQMIYSSLLSLPLPLMVFLWGMLSVPRPSKTFWVTVITYTESVVVCKYFYQFGFFPWNDDIYRDSPFFPPLIIGIAKSSNYASVDIALLLALFLHRSILRTYGLWRDAADISADLAAAGIKEKSMSESESNVDESFISETEHTMSEETIRVNSRFMQGIYFVLNPFANFFHEVTHSTYSASTDMYMPMFFCDLILFLVLVFGFSSFGPADTTGDENVAKYLRESKIPIPFVIMLITQFIFILIDRAIFLRKFVLGKYIFQILLVLIIHVWMFFVLPAITKRSFYDNVAAQIWYFIKSIYFALSAYQIRSGYPVRTIGNILTKSYGFANLILYKGFLAIPFLLELRALMDWTWSDSTLAIGNWLQMEDIYANIFVIKCWREFERRNPQQRAVKKSTAVKYLAGGALLTTIIFIVWFPLLFFAFLNTLFVSDPPIEASITIGIGGYQPLFTATATGDSIRPLTAAEFSSLKSHYSRDRIAYSFLSHYEPEDVTLIEFDGKSLSIWGISQIGQDAMAQDLNRRSGGKLDLSVKLRFLRAARQSQSGEAKKSFVLDLQHPSQENMDAAVNLANIIRGKYNNSVEIYGAFSRYLRLTNQPEAIVMDGLIGGKYGIGRSNISLQLNVITAFQTSESWSLNETLQGPTVFNYEPESEQFSVPRAYVITFNDRKTPPSLEFISRFSIFTGGVMVMYVSFVLVVFKFIRVSFVSGRTLYIHLEEAPDVDYLIQTIDDMYLAREMKDYWLEEELFAKLLFILRCPDVLFYVTRIRSIIPVAVPPPQIQDSTSDHIEQKPQDARKTETNYLKNPLSTYMTLYKD